MAFEDKEAELGLLLTRMQHEPDDVHELYQQIRLKLNEMKAYGMPLPASCNSSKISRPSSLRRKSMLSARRVWTRSSRDARSVDAARACTAVAMIAVAQACAVKGAPLGGRAKLALDRATRRQGNGYGVNGVDALQAVLDVMPLARRATTNRMTAAIAAPTRPTMASPINPKLPALTMRLASQPATAPMTTHIAMTTGSIAILVPPNGSNPHREDERTTWVKLIVPARWNCRRDCCRTDTAAAR